ncbi:MAG TPA: MFS transporter [Chloroflexota bacterium]|nr:MFS transporter [Chloroflexota bacterium]
MSMASTRDAIRARANYQWLVLATVCLGTFMGAMDSSIVNVTLPLLSTTFSVDLPTIGWVAIAYQLAATCTLGTFGRLTDIFGRRSIYLAGFAVFVVGSALCGQANDALTLILFRVFQGIGSAMLVANSMALLTHVFPSHQRGTAIGFLETSVSLAFTVAPTLGGFLQTLLGWRSVFYVNIPIGAFGIILAYLIITDPPRAAGNRPRSLDLPGAALLMFSLSGIMLALTRGIGDEPGAAYYRWLALPAVLAFAGFIYVEGRATDPTIDLSLFRHRVFAGANAAKVFSYAAMSSVTFLMPFYLEQGLGLSPTLTGLGMTALPVALALGSMTGGPLSDRFGSHVLAPIGMIIASGGALVLTQVAPSQGYPPVMVAMFLVGLGMGLFIVPNDSAIMGAAPRDKLGVASGILATTRNLGLSSGIAFSGTLLAALTQVYAARPSAFVAAYQAVYFITIGLCLVAMVLSLFRGKAGHGAT